MCQVEGVGQDGKDREEAHEDAHGGPRIREGGVKIPDGAAELLISMTERQLHSQVGIEKGKLRLSRTPLGCGQVLTGVALRGEKSQEGEEVSAEFRALQAATTKHALLGGKASMGQPG